MLDKTSAIFVQINGLIYSLKSPETSFGIHVHEVYVNVGVDCFCTWLTCNKVLILLINTISYAWITTGTC